MIGASQEEESTMSPSADRPTSVVDRPAAPMAARAEEPGTSTTSRADSGPVPQGWGSHEDRWLMRWGVVGFLLLAAYAIGFIVVGALVWS
jgi:hypothetical protein